VSWDPHALPSAAGRTVVVTGGNAGIGYFTAEQLAGAGARVILASRSAERAQRAIDSIRERVPSAELEFVPLDLASLASVARSAAELATRGPIDVLINNAGIVNPSARRRTTEDGLELLVGANALGHFALTAQLWPSLAPDARVIGLGSMATRMVRLAAGEGIGDLLSERRYRPFRAYGLSKHTVHATAFELDRRIRAVGSSRRSLLAHPGFSVDGLSERRPGINDLPLSRRLRDGALSFLAQGKQQGAWPTVRAALDPDAESGRFYGPNRTLTGLPIVMVPVLSSADPAFGARFWAFAEERTGVHFDV
jgi:NAD(P)-dependent dehydrogenase (short-subunit alcohol dehydrogenase family)